MLESLGRSLEGTLRWSAKGPWCAGNGMAFGRISTRRLMNVSEFRSDHKALTKLLP
jgi:hypothetical protein